MPIEPRDGLSACLLIVSKHLEEFFEVQLLGEGCGALQIAKHDR
jgi:hypothetical protein